MPPDSHIVQLCFCAYSKFSLTVQNLCNSNLLGKKLSISLDTPCFHINYIINATICQRDILKEKSCCCFKFLSVGRGMAGSRGCLNDLFGEIFGDVPAELEKLDFWYVFPSLWEMGLQGCFPSLWCEVLFVGIFFLLLVRGGLTCFYIIWRFQ